MKDNKKIITFIFISSCFALILFKFRNILMNLKALVIIMSFIILILIYSIIIKNKKYKNLDKISESNKKEYKRAIDELDAVVWEWNSEDKELYFSPKIKNILMIEKNISSFYDFLSFVIEEERENIKSFIDKIIKEKISDNFILQSTIINKIGEKLLIEIQGRSKVNNNVLYISGFITDITEIKRTENIKEIIEDKGSTIQLQNEPKKCSERDKVTFIYESISDITEKKEIENNYLSYSNDITSIPNRDFFIKEVTEHIKSNPKEKMAIIFIDLDNFKYINDTYGHDVGDKFLIKLTKLIKEINIEKFLLARYGGDEFVIAKYNLKGKDQIKVILDNIIDKISKPIMVDDKEVFCTLSIGVTIYPLDGENIEALVKRADMAMYLAKVNGKNRYEFFDISILERLDREFKIEKGLRTAVDNNEIQMVYQPKVNAFTEEVTGFEALVRWNSKELGFISPAEFIPIAENSGIIIPLGKYIIDESFKRCKELTLLTDKPFKIAINLSDVQIRDSEIVEYIRKALEKYNLDAKYIEFEITESIIMKFPDRNIKTLGELKKLGVTLALDDFGTGYSSLSYLRTLPIDVLKIDKSFIDGILIEKKSEYIINSVVELSHFLELVVVAEGVETSDQLKYLRNINCDIIQGYYYSRPLEFINAKTMIVE